MPVSTPQTISNIMSIDIRHLGSSEPVPRPGGLLRLQGRGPSRGLYYSSGFLSQTQILTPEGTIRYALYSGPSIRRAGGEPTPSSATASTCSASKGLKVLRPGPRQRFWKQDGKQFAIIPLVF